MKKTIKTILLLVLTHASFSQVLTFQAALDSGKAEYKKQATADSADFSKACQLLKQAVALQPGNAEARYFLGYAIDKLNGLGAACMNLSKKALTLQASEQFEMVNKIDPEYKGEILILDPYAKISSIWGSQAMTYLAKNDLDSSKWAFRNGKKRGGFIEPILEFNRQLLKSCGKNGILVTNGDDLTFPLWYLQEMENLRTDITVVEAGMIVLPWYDKYLKHRKHLAMSYSDAAIDTINYLPWKDTTITITNPVITGKAPMPVHHSGFATKSLIWTLEPTYLGKYILKSDRILLDIVEQNLFIRPIYFQEGSDSTYNLFLDERLENEGLVDRVDVYINDDTMPERPVSANLTSYSIDKLNAADIKKSKDAISLLNMFRWAYVTNVDILYTLKQVAEARALLHEMDRKFPVEKLPYSSEHLQQKVERLRQLLFAESAFAK